MRSVFVTACIALLSACGGPPAITGCTAVGDLVPACGLNNPEDMELLPDGHTLVVSLMGDIRQAAPGALAFYDTRDGAITHLPHFTDETAENWGGADCPGPPGAAFSPHGIHLSTRADGRLQLLAVDHGGGERIEFFEIAGGEAGYRVDWRGCVPAPAGSLLNDVAALPGGGFVVTDMFGGESPRIGQFNLGLFLGLLGVETGYVLRWDGAGFTRVEGSGAQLPNGIQVSPDGAHLYLDVYLAGEVRKIAFPSGKLEAVAEVSGPDNIQWDGHGRLLVASQTKPLREILRCFDIAADACGAGFEVVALDPDTLQAQTLFRHAGAPMGAATVAQRVGDFLYLGTFAGDRMLRVPLRGAPAGS